MLRNDQTLLTWTAPAHRPEEGSYILVKCINESGQVCCEPCAYENGKFIYIYGRDSWGELNEALILGWSYYPYDCHPSI